MSDELDFSNFPTSDQPVEGPIKDETDRMLDEVLLTLKLERAVIFVKVDGAWRVSSAHEVPTNNFLFEQVTIGSEGQTPGSKQSSVRASVTD